MTPATTASALDVRQRYEQDGFAIVRGVFADRVTALQRDAELLLGLTALIDQNNIRCRWQNDAETGECRFDCFDPVIDLSSVCESVARDSRLLADRRNGLRRGRAPLQGQADLQGAGHDRLQAAPGLHRLAVVSDLVHDRDRRHRPR